MEKRYRKAVKEDAEYADSVIILDEVHTLPIDYLQPCLKAISYITTFLNSEAIFMTATMPDYRSGIGTISDEQLLLRCRRAPSCLVIVNKKKTARKLYNECLNCNIK